jgi:hypothetical protein
VGSRLDPKKAMAGPPAETYSRERFAVEAAAMDEGYDNNRLYSEREDRDVRAFVPLRHTPRR